MKYKKTDWNNYSQLRHSRQLERKLIICFFWDDRSWFVLVLFQFCPSVWLCDTPVICDHTFQLIETILVSSESPKILISEKVNLVQIGHN